MPSSANNPRPGLPCARPAHRSPSPWASRQITVPDLIGKTQKQAAALLAKAGATKVTYTNAGTPPRGQAGRVQGQSVPANTAVPADTPIAVNVYGK